LSDEVRVAFSSPLAAVPKDLDEARETVPALRRDLEDAAAVAPEEVREDAEATADFIAAVDEGLKNADTSAEADAVAQAMVAQSLELEDDRTALRLLAFMNEQCGSTRVEPGSYP
jgi:hypothetical protein